jgi:ATP-dependent helicase YprA (DUF1998 family)
VSAASRTLGVSSSDLNSSVQKFQTGQNYINIFDTTPGGIGLTISISERLNEIIRVAAQLSIECPNCREDASCYACLRSYTNQRRHDHLVRKSAREVLLNLLA